MRQATVRCRRAPAVLGSVMLALCLAAAVPASAANLLFRTGFEDATVLQPVDQRNCWNTGCWQVLGGTDASTGYSWPPQIWGGAGYLQLLADAPVDAASVGQYLFEQLLSVTGHKGSSTRVLYEQATQSGCCGGDPQGWGATSGNLVILPAAEAGDMYISYWLKLQPDLWQQLTPQNWRFVFSWKTSGDYRTVLQVVSWGNVDGNVAPYWQVLGDNNANGGLAYEKFWQVDNKAVPVPIGRWFKLEVFWHRSGGSDGRVWMAVDGQVICDRSGPNMGVDNDPINRIFVSGLYGGGPYPMYQWLDDLQIWDGFPAAASGDAWYDPPYAPH